MSWLYSISKHTFSYPGLSDVSEGVYSGGGVPPAHNSFLVNAPEACKIQNFGPIPPGTWTMAALVATGEKTGPDTIILTPDGATAALCGALNRQPSSFRIHGDSIANPGQGSDGCIVAPRDFRVKVLWLSADKTIIVVP